MQGAQSIIADDYLRSVLEKPHVERDFFEIEMLISFFSKMDFFISQSKYDLPRARFLELSRIIEKHLPYLKFFALKPGQTIYSKNYKLQSTFMVVKGAVMLYKDSKRDIFFKSKGTVKLSIDNTNIPPTSETNANVVSTTNKIFKTEEPEFSTLSSWATESGNHFAAQRRESKISEKITESSHSNQETRHIRNISNKAPATIVRAQPEIQTIGPKLVLHRKVDIGGVFGVVENENYPEQTAICEGETWVVAFSMKYHKKILEDQKKYTLKIFSLIESILQRSFNKEEISTLAHYFDETHPLQTDKIYAEGEASNVFYFLVHGSVFLLKDIEGKTLYEAKHLFKKLITNQKKRIVDKLMPGNGFGEEMILETPFRKLSAITKSDYTILLALYRANWDEICHNYIELSQKFINTVKANAFWRHQRLQAHLKELSSMTLSLGDLKKDIPESLTKKIEIPILDPRIKTPKIKMHSSPLARSPQAKFFLSNLSSPVKTSESKTRIKIASNPAFLTEHQTQSKPIIQDDLATTFSSSNAWHKRFFKFQPSISDYFIMTEEEKENLHRITKKSSANSPKEFLSPRVAKTDALSPLINSTRVRAISPPTTGELKKTKMPIRVKKLKKKNSAVDLLQLNPELSLEEREKEPKPIENLHLNDKNQSHIERLESLSVRLNEIAINIGLSLGDFGKKK